MKKVSLLVLSLLILTLMFSSCSFGDISTKKFLENYKYDEFALLANNAKVSSLTDASQEYNQSRELICFRKDDNVIVYNLATDATVFTVKSSNYSSISFFTCFAKTFFRVITYQKVDGVNEYTTAIYSANGNKVVEKKGNYSNSITTSCDLFEFEKAIYKVDSEGNAEFFAETLFVGSLSSNLIKTNSYYYKKSSSSITVYDHSMNLVSYWEMPYSTDMSIISPLSDGKILVQYADALPEDSDSYEIFAEGEKYNLKSFIIDAKTGNETEINIDYLVQVESFGDQIVANTSGVNLSGINAALIARIKDKHLITASNQMEYVSIDNNANIVGKICSDLPNFSSFYGDVAVNRFIYTTANGDYVLIDGEGNTIGKINGFTNSKYNDKYFAINGKIYDYNLKVVYDLEVNGYSIYCSLAHGYILSDKNNDYYLFTNGEIKALEGSISSYSNQWFITSNNNKYTLYNEDGSVILSGERYDNISVVTTIDNVALVYFYDYSESTTNYYRITK